MPNNASARRDKDKKKKDKKKKKDPKPLHKEDNASQDSNSLSVAGKDETRLDLSFSLDRMEEAIQEYATGEAAEDSGSEHMKKKKVLRVELLNKLSRSKY
jgi:hypothetical protein